MSLRHALLELNRDVNGSVPGLIEIDRETIGLNSRACWMDVHAEPDRAEQLLSDLEGISVPFDEWLASERARFEDRVRKALEEGLEQLISENVAPQLRAEHARKLINFEPTHEGAVRALMIAFAEMGDRAQAIREYERCRQALRSVFDLAPSKETTAVYEAIRLVGASQPSLLSQFAGWHDQAPSTINGIREVTTPIADQPSIAVLPFRNLSGNSAHDYAGDGLVEDLIEMLSRVPNFFVISRLSARVSGTAITHPRRLANYWVFNMSCPVA